MTDHPSPLLLCLDTIVRREAIEIDGKRYEVLSPDELSVLDSHRFSHWAKRLEELQNAEASAGEAPEMDELADRIARKVLLDVPPDLFGKLSGAQKIAVAEVFIALLLRSRMKVAGAAATAMGQQAIGEAFSRASSGSTAASPAPGWRTRLSRWLGRI